MARRRVDEFEVAQQLSARSGQTITAQVRTSADGRRRVRYLDEQGDPVDVSPPVERDDPPRERSSTLVVGRFVAGEWVGRPNVPLEE